MYDPDDFSGLTIAGISGCQRSGKTTLAKELASYLNQHGVNAVYVDASVRHANALIGNDPKVSGTLAHRLNCQIGITNHLHEVLTAAKINAQGTSDSTLLILDRSFMDIAAYMITEVLRDSDQSLNDEICGLINRLYELQAYWFHHLTITDMVKAAIEKQEATSAQSWWSYNFHFQSTLKGLVEDANFRLRHPGSRYIVLSDMPVEQRTHILAHNLIRIVQRHD